MDDRTPEQQLILHMAAATPIIFVQAFEEEPVVRCVTDASKQALLEGVYDNVWMWTATDGLRGLSTGGPERAKLTLSADFIAKVPPPGGIGGSPTLSYRTETDDIVTSRPVELSSVLFGFREFMRTSAPPPASPADVPLHRTDTLILPDAGTFLANPNQYPVHRLLSEIAVLARTSSRNFRVIMIDVGFAPPVRMERLITHIRWPLPDQGELQTLAQSIATAQGVSDVKADHLRLVAESLAGLTRAEATRVCLGSITMSGGLSPKLAVEEKANLVAKSGVLTFLKPIGDLDQVGGLVNLKEWLRLRRRAFGEDAKEFGLRSPRGAVLIGVPGTGKSLTAKCIGAAWNMPVLQLDIGALLGSLVGESEQRFRAAIATAEAVAPAVLFLDEFEKMWGTGGERDGGIMSRLLGSFLTWLNDHTSPVFSLLAGNSVERIPDEFLRAGRFDGMFFTDLPTAVERMEILNIALTTRKRASRNFDLRMLADATKGFTGAELTQLVEASLYMAFDRRTELTQEILLENIPQINLVSTTMGDRLTAIREWGVKNALPASAPEEVVAFKPAPATGPRLGTLPRPSLQLRK